MNTRHDTMIEPQVEGLLDRAGSKFSLVTLAARRARRVDGRLLHVARLTLHHERDDDRARDLAVLLERRVVAGLDRLVRRLEHLLRVVLPAGNGAPAAADEREGGGEGDCCGN